MDKIKFAERKLHEEPMKLSRELSKEILEFIKTNPGIAQDLINVTNIVGVENG